MADWSLEDDAILAAVQLAAALDAGWRPGAARSPITLFPGETYAQDTPFALFEFAGRDVAYRSSTFVGLGSPLFLAATVGASLALNAARRRQAEAEAAHQWRVIADGRLHVTSLRFGLQSWAGWFDIAYRDVRASECHQDGVVLFLDGRAPVKLQVAWPAYLFVLFRFLAYGEIARPDPGAEFVRRAVAAGRQLPAGMSPAQAPNKGGTNP